MFYLICFISGLFIGAVSMFAAYVIKTWLPIVRAAETAEPSKPSGGRLTREQQWDELTAYSGVAVPRGH